MTQAIAAIDKRDHIRPFLLQVGIVFLLILTLPLDRHYYQVLGAIQIGHIHFQDLFQAANYVPFLGHAGALGWEALTGWSRALALAFVAAAIWARYDKTFIAYEDLWQYGLRVVLRYRLAAALLSYGFILLFAVQAPSPALSDLHTKYGYFLPWKIYYESLSVASAGYGPTLGVFEILGGVLLLFRRTTLIGAGIAAFLLINIVLANFAYQLGDQVISVYLLLIALVLIAYDGPRLYQLLFREKKTAAETFHPVFAGRRATVRLSLKALFVLFFLVYATLLYKSYSIDKWPYPQTPGLPGAAGFYDVRHFRLNGTDRPYSLVDSLRWEDVVFEKWNTISVNENRTTPINQQRPVIAFQGTGIERVYESLGNGQRSFYSYEVNGDHLTLINKNDGQPAYLFEIKRPASGQILLDGRDKAGNTLQIELSKVDKKYLLYLGRRHPVKVY